MARGEDLFAPQARIAIRRSQKFGNAEFLFERLTPLRFQRANRPQGAGPGFEPDAGRSDRWRVVARRERILCTHTNNRQDALTMLTEPDLHARYLVATLGVIETEISKLGLKANDRRALDALVAGATRAATRLAGELERSGAANALWRSPAPIEHYPDNVVAFVTVRNVKR